MIEYLAREDILRLIEDRIARRAHPPQGGWNACPVTMKGRGLRPKQDPEATLRQRVRDTFRWVHDPDRDIDGADGTGWWRDADPG